MKPIDQYLAKLSEVHGLVQERWAAFEYASTSSNAKRATTAAGELKESLRKLQDLLTPETYPEWLQPMLQSSSTLTNPTHWEKDQTRTVQYRKLHQWAKPMAAYSFSVQTIKADVSPLINIDDVVEECFDSEKLAELYRKAIQAIEEAITAGIDSRKIESDLTRLLALIRGVEGTSFVNQRYQVPVILRYLRAAVKVAAKRVPVLNLVAETIEEANRELEVSNKQILDKLNELAEERALQFGAVIEHETDPALPAPSGSGNDDGGAVGEESAKS